MRLKEKKLKLVQRLEVQYAENDELKKELEEVKRKQQPTPSTPVMSMQRCKLWTMGES